MKNDYITVWHGTNKKNHRGILKSGFRPFCWFAKDESTARRYALMTVSRVSSAVVMQITINKNALYDTGDYYTAKGALNLIGGRYELKPVK